MDAHREGPASFARCRLVGILLAAVFLATPAGASAAPSPFVTIDAKLVRTDDGATVTGRVDWNAAAAKHRPDLMTVGDLRLVAVSGRGHHPRLLGKATYSVPRGARQDVRFPIAGDDDLAAIRPGNRVVLTASQHGAISPGTRTARTYVTVGELQPYGTPQGRIGRNDCSATPIVAGAVLNGCDLVGAYLDRALVSVRKPTGTRMLLADLTGATMVEADLTGLSVAGGRVNGADATRSVLDNVSLAGAEGTGFVARGATSDQGEGTAGANVFDARMMDSDFRGALLNGVSLDHSRFDGADFTGATWHGVVADTADFRDADLRGLTQLGSSVYFADFTDAKLRGADRSAIDLAWATLCRTAMPDGSPAGGEDRDCRTATEPSRAPAAGRLVAVDGDLDRDGDDTRITGVVRWNAPAIRGGMSAGDVRAVAIDRSTGRPTPLGAVPIRDGLPATTRVDLPVSGRVARAAVERGNRVVLTATQHAPLPRATQRTTVSYVTVDVLQPGPGRGRVGQRDCSALPLSATTPAAEGYEFCDLAGAALTQALLPGPLRKADLTGAELARSTVDGVVFDGAALGGVTLTGADVGGVSMIEAFAPELTLPKTLVHGAELRAASLDDADFTGSTISDTTFAAAPLRRASLRDATLDKVDLGYARLAGAKLDRVDAASSDPQRARRSSLFLADLTGATLKDSQWDDDESGERPWRWATLCDTVMPPHAAISGDRDCPR